MLNLLISIVGETYGYVIDHEAEQRMRGRIDLNGTAVNEASDTTETIHSLVICAKAVTEGGDADEEKGDARRVKRMLKKFHNDIKSNLDKFDVIEQAQQDFENNINSKFDQIFQRLKMNGEADEDEEE